jgi:NAD(P)-dependent dehydrogenase (short-subunit alcohol dehydrogenase family)
MREIWTKNDIPDQTGKVAIVTGANSGIGFEAAKELANKGAMTILACRDLDKADRAAIKIKDQNPFSHTYPINLDLANLKSVHQFTDHFREKYDRLDLLLNNAGIMMVPYGTTEDGFELQFGTNHLGHFALTGLLIDLIMKTPKSRVVNVSSGAHHSGRINFENLMYEKGTHYSASGAYNQSKLANLLFTYELQRRLADDQSGTIAVATHPGASNTCLGDHILTVKVLRHILGSKIQSAAMGALPSLRAATDPDVLGGQYYGPGEKNQTRGHPVVVSSSPASHDLSSAEKLWKVSEELTGIQYL